MVSRRLFRFSLRTFLIFIIVVAVWLGVELNRGRRQQAAIATIRREGGSIYHRAPSGRLEPGMTTDAPAWLVEQVGDGFFGEVERLYPGDPLTVESMSSVTRLRSIRQLNLYASTLSEPVLEPLGRLTTLVHLDIGATNITDRGLKTVGTLPNLRELSLSGCDHVTDASLRGIEDLQLEKLWLDQMPITGEGLVWLRNMKGLQHLNLFNTSVTDSALLHVHHLSGLRDLNLNGTQVTDEGLKCLRELPNLEVLNLNSTKISDQGIMHMRHLKKLTCLYVGDTEVTSDGVAKLQKALPGCTIYNWQHPKSLFELLGF